MDSYEHCVVGSGPAGVAAARRLEGTGLCIVDAGDEPRRSFPFSTLSESLASADADSLLGSHWEMCANLVHPKKVHPKLRADAVGYVAAGEPFRVCDAAGEVILRGAGSYATGGMSNAWGAQLFRYTDADLAEVRDWPLEASELTPYYEDLERHIGIAGTKDDMNGYFGDPAFLLPPPPIVPAAEHLLRRYRGRKARGARLDGFALGFSRLGILTEEYRGYSRFEFGETEFFSTEQQGMYTARRSLEELVGRGRVKLRRRQVVTGYRERDEYVEVALRDRDTNEASRIRTRHLLLACGTLHTGRLVLLNSGEPGRSLPFIDHPPTLLPIFVPAQLATAKPARSFPVQLAGTFQESGHREMISFYYPGGLLLSDLVPDVPLPIDSALSVLPHLIAGMLVAQIWETSRPHPANRLALDQERNIYISYAEQHPYRGVKRLLRALRSLGAYSTPGLASTSLPGWGFHYAGCLPMRSRPAIFETHADGRLWNSRRVRVLDGSVLPSLPAKNHSLTLMANAARIADEAVRCGY